MPSSWLPLAAALAAFVAGLLVGWYCALLIVLALIANASALHRFYHATKGQT